MLEFWQKLFRKRGPKAVVRDLVALDPSRGHRPHRRFHEEEILEKLPLFTLRRAQMMMHDTTVKFGLSVRDAALSSGEVAIDSEDPAVAEYVQDQWDRIWGVHGYKIRKTKCWGYGGFQVLFGLGKASKQLEITGLKDFSPFDVRALTHNAEVCGFKVRYRGRVRQSGHTTPIYSPRALWTTFDSHWGNIYGRSINRRSYGPWWEKWMDHGAKEVGRIRMMKDASRGDVYWYPPERTITDPEGNVIPWRDLAREMAENTLSGAALTLPMMYDNEGRKLVDYTPPVDMGNPTGIWEWLTNLDRDILWGLGVPREIIEAAETGSGFSGRSIPLAIFLGNIDEEFKELVMAIDRDVLRPMVWLTFGEDADYQLKATTLVETFAEDLGGSAMGGESMGGGQAAPEMGGGGVLPEQQGAAGQNGEGRQAAGPYIDVQLPDGRTIKRRNPYFGRSQQFSDYEEAEHPRDKGGKWSEKGERAIAKRFGKKTVAKHKKPLNPTTEFKDKPGTFWRIHRTEFLPSDVEKAHTSELWTGEEDILRQGLSTVARLEDLVAYFIGEVGTSVGRGASLANTHLVQVKGEPSDADALEENEILIRPTQLLSSTPIQDTPFMDMVREGINRWRADETEEYDYDFEKDEWVTIPRGSLTKRRTTAQFSEGATEKPHDELVRIGSAAAGKLLSDTAAQIRGLVKKKRSI